MAQERISPLEESIKDPLPRLKKELTEEFEGQPEVLNDQAAKHSLDRYKVREFVRSSPGDTPALISAAPRSASPLVHLVAISRPTGGHHRLLSSKRESVAGRGRLPGIPGISTIIFGTCSVCFAEFFEDEEALQP